MRKPLFFSANETVLRASVARETPGTTADDRPVAILHPEIFEDSVVKPTPLTSETLQPPSLPDQARPKMLRRKLQVPR